MNPLMKIVAVSLFAVGCGSAQAVTVLCWGNGIPCFHVSNCGGYPACDGHNQPCCLGGAAAFSDRNVGSDGTGVAGIEIVADRPGTAVVDRFYNGQLIDELYIDMPKGNTPVTTSFDKVNWDFFRVYVDGNPKGTVECLELRRHANCGSALTPSVYRIDPDNMRVRIAPD